MPALFAVLVLLAVGAGAQSWVVGGDSGEPWGDVQERWIALDDTSLAGSIQPTRIPRGRNVLREVVRTGGLASQVNFFGYRWAFFRGPLLLEADTLDVGWYPRMWEGGNANAIAGPIMRGLVDGDGLTSGFTHNARFDGKPNTAKFFTFDLGLSVPIDSVVFFPPQSGLTPNNERQRELFPRGYEVSRTNTPADWLIFENETTVLGSAGYHPLDEVIGSTFSNNESVVSLTPDLQFTRFLRFKVGEVTTTTMIAEIEAFGRGFPQEARFVSKPHDFGEGVGLGRVDYSFRRFRLTSSGEAVEDDAAPVELLLRTRAGNDPQPKTFFVFDELGRQLEVDSDTYFASPRVVERFSEGIAGFRAARGDDTENWNNWSVPYERSGQENRSSDGRRYFQFRFDIVSDDPLAFAVLDSISFEVAPLLADSVLAEISIDGAALGDVEVPLGVDTTFVYDIRTVAGRDRAGYDVIEVDVPIAAQFIDLEIDGEPASQGGEYEVEHADGPLRILLSSPVTDDRQFRLRFRSAMFQPSLFLGGRVANRVTVGLPQSIEGGDARQDVASNDIQIVSSNERFNVLGPVRLASQVITPNGDGRNDEARIEFDLFGVNGAEMTVRVYDLAGRLVETLVEGTAAAGPVNEVWDGRLDGALAAPGLYLIRVEVAVDEGTATRVQPVAVAY